MKVVVNPGFKVRDRLNRRDCVAGEEFEVPEKEARLLKALRRVSDAPAAAPAMAFVRSAPPAAPAPPVNATPAPPSATFVRAIPLNPIARLSAKADDDEQKVEEERETGEVRPETTEGEKDAQTGEESDRQTRRYRRRDLSAQN